VREIVDELKYILSAKEKGQLAGLFFMMLAGGFLELLGVSVVLPLVQAIMQPDAEIIGVIGGIIGPGEGVHRRVVVFLALLLIALYIIKNGFLLWMYHVIFSFVYKGMKNLSSRMLSVYMGESYAKHLHRNVSQIQRTVRGDVSGCYYVVKFLLQIMTEAIICITLVGYLLLTDVKITVFLMALLGICCGLFLFFSKKKVKELGTISQNSQTKMNQWILQSMGGMKEVRLLGRESYFVEMYNEQNKAFADVNRKQQVILQMPRMLTETVCICGVMILLIVAAKAGESMENMVPVFAVFAVAAFRMLPSVGKINTFLTELIYYRPTVHAVYRDLKELEGERCYSQKECSELMPFRQVLSLKDVSFRYWNTEENVLKNVSLEVPRGKAVALIGPSGAGKTTLADLIMGLLEPGSGEVSVDGTDIKSNLSGWYRQIGYVPQSIYLSDDTIQNNVAFGLREEEIDEEKLWKALELAQIAEFVKQLPEGIETRVGEQGVRLSGGQRQRIGIARALYHDPELLVLDEATSALDTDTEKAVMDAINHLHGEKTMVIIAHRLTTIEKCDIIYEVTKQGVVQKKD